MSQETRMVGQTRSLGEAMQMEMKKRMTPWMTTLMQSYTLFNCQVHLRILQHGSISKQANMSANIWPSGNIWRLWSDLPTLRMTSFGNFERMHINISFATGTSTSDPRSAGSPLDE